MLISVNVSGRQYEIDPGEALDISIPMYFNGNQPNSYNVRLATSKPYEIGNFIGDTRLGGSCNFEEYSFVPHCNGTHTECVGHITFERISVLRSLKDVFIPASVITVNPLQPDQTHDSYDPQPEDDDLMITSDSVNDALKGINTDFLKGLIIRTLPNDESKKTRRYMDSPPPFLTIEAMRLIRQLDVNHLLLDIPSVDKTFDEGKLNAHRIFWDMKQGSHDVENGKHSVKTITEMVYVPDEIKNGEYVLNLQIAPFESDAVPSRPVLFKIKNQK